MVTQLAAKYGVPSGAGLGIVYDCNNFIEQGLFIISWPETFDFFSLTIEGTNGIPQTLPLENLGSCPASSVPAAQCLAEPTSGTSGGDPVASYAGRSVQYYLPVNKFTPVFDQGPIVVSQKAGPANPPKVLANHKGAWVTSLLFDFAALIKIDISIYDPMTLLGRERAQVENENAAPERPTLNVSVLGQPAPLPLGKHVFDIEDAQITVSIRTDPDNNRIGKGVVQRIDVKTDDFHMRATSTKANKFAHSDLQVLGMHLDVEFLEFEEGAARGLLPQLWGMQPPGNSSVFTKKPKK